MYADSVYSQYYSVHFENERQSELIPIDMLCTNIITTAYYIIK